MRLAESMKSKGWQGRPILTVDLGRGHEALTGTHRIAAAQKAGIEIPVHMLPNKAGEHEDRHNRTIQDAMYMDADDAAKWLKSAGYHEASALMMDEHHHQTQKMAKGGAVNDTEYRGEHAAPGPESGKPMHDTTDVYPADFYGPRGFDYYANTHQPYDRASYDTVAAARGNPDKMVWAHRAVPKDVYKAAMKTSEPTAHMIRPGDWVTPSREYAKEHGEGLGEGYHIARKRVPAKHLYTNADSIHEWGYHPEPMQKKREGGVTLPPSTEQMRQALSARRSNSKA